MGEAGEHRAAEPQTGAPWWLGLAPAEASVSCQGAEHRLRWQDGQLHALDHEDLESERTLAVLGSQRCTCLEVSDAWAAHREDPRVLLLGSRGPLDPLLLADRAAEIGWTPSRAQTVALSGAGWARYRSGGSGSFATMRAVGPSPLARRAGRARGRRMHIARPATPRPRGERSELTNDEQLIGLLGLGGGLPERLTATVAAALGERLTRDAEAMSAIRPQLTAALHGRASLALQAWLGQSRQIKLRMIDTQGQPALLDRGGAIEAQLPLRWLAEVWAKGLATIWGRFCLQAHTSDGRSFRLVAIAPDLGEPEAIALRLAGPARGA